MDFSISGESKMMVKAARDFARREIEPIVAKVEVEDELPEDILQDRRAFFNFLDFSTLDEQLPHLYAQFRGHLQLVDSMLAHGAPYILGNRPGWVDILAYFPLWMARGNIGNTDELVRGLAALPDWDRVFFRVMWMRRLTNWGLLWSCSSPLCLFMTT